MRTISRYLTDFAALLFPRVCACCSRPLVQQESQICTDCLYHLPYTDFHLDPDNRAARELWGRLPAEGVTSLLHFSKSTRVQQLMHQLKYRNNPGVGRILGAQYGRILKQVSPFSAGELIIPVPLHRRKQRKRGYNQSEYIASGLATELEIPVCSGNLVRLSHNESQTGKNRFTRAENMEGRFAVRRPEELENKHVLLVDDVLTTGATLEACGTELRKVPGVTISIVTLAYAR